MVKGSVLLMIAALVCALFADKIDAAVKGGDQENANKKTL